MSITRRQFLLGTAAGLVLPRFFEKVFSYVANHEEPMLWAPKSAQTVMYAVPELAYAGYQLNLGDVTVEPPGSLTVREFCERFAVGDPATWFRKVQYDRDEPFPLDWDHRLGEDFVFEWWQARHSTSLLAARYVESIDLGPQLIGGEPVGTLALSLGGMCSSLYAYDAVDDVSLSLLQNRLNEINSGIRIELLDWGDQWKKDWQHA